MLESLNYSFRNPKNIIWVMYRIKQLRNYKKNHGVLRGPQLGKQRWRPRLGISRVNDLYNSSNVSFLLSLRTSSLLSSTWIASTLTWWRGLSPRFLANFQISFATISIWGSLWRSAFLIHQGASMMNRCVLNRRRTSRPDRTHTHTTGSKLRCQTPTKHRTKYLWITTSNFSQAKLCTRWWWIT